MKRVVISLAVVLVFLFGCFGCTAKPDSDTVTPTITAPSYTPTPRPTKTPDQKATATSDPFHIDFSELDIEQQDQRVNILLLGSDQRRNLDQNTDVIILLSLDPDKGTASMLSFPRDLYIEIPGVGNDRINTTQRYGGFSMTRDVFQQNFGVRVDYYLMTNFTGFKDIVNLLGGITVNAAYEFADTCPNAAADNYCVVHAGENIMDGSTALWYVRSRYSTSDYDRTRRAQEVMLAIFKKAISLDAVDRSAEFFDLFKSSVETDIPFSKIVELLPLAVQLGNDPSRIKQYSIGAESTSAYIVPVTGDFVLMWDKDAVSEIVNRALNN